MLLTVDGDVTGVQLAAVKRSTVAGRITFEKTDADSTLPEPSKLRVFADSRSKELIGAGGTAVAKSDYTFEVKTPPVHVAITTNVNGSDTWMLESVRVGGADVTDTGFDVPANGSVRGIELVMTDRVSELSGTATDASGRPTRTAFVVVFSRDRGKWNSRYVRMARPQPDLKFHVRVPPGEYFVAAFDFLEQGEWNDPELLSAAIDRAVPITIGAGEKKTVDVKVASTGGH